MKFRFRTIEHNENLYLRKEDVAEFIREAAADLPTDDRKRFEEAARNIRQMEQL